MKRYWKPGVLLAVLFGSALAASVAMSNSADRAGKTSAAATAPADPAAAQAYLKEMEQRSIAEQPQAY